MLIVLVRVVLLFTNLNIGIFVITLGVMLWTSAKSRAGRQRVHAQADRVQGHNQDEVKSSFGGIVAVRRDRHDSRPGAGRLM